MKALHSTEDCPKCGYNDFSYEFVPQTMVNNIYSAPIYGEKDYKCTLI